MASDRLADRSRLGVASMPRLTPSGCPRGRTRTPTRTRSVAADPQRTGLFDRSLSLLDDEPVDTDIAAPGRGVPRPRDTDLHRVKPQRHRLAVGDDVVPIARRIQVRRDLWTVVDRERGDPAAGRLPGVHVDPRAVE